MVSSPAPSPSDRSAGRWPTTLFYVTVLAVLAMAWQQATDGNGDQIARTVAFLIPMVFPVGMAFWGKKAGMSGPALGGIAMAALFWLAMVLGSPGGMGDMGGMN